jgi:hypothetical protein
MAKRKSFEDILKTEFRWPTKGDKPFVVADDPFDNANIADDAFTRLVLMMDGYKEAADLMVDRAASDRPIRDMLVCPIIFLITHKAQPASGAGTASAAFSPPP